MFSRITALKYFITAISVVLYSCAPALYKPLPEHASTTTSYEQLLTGRSLYVSSCGSCHSLYLPQQYDEKVWAHNLDEMQTRAKLSDSQKELILEYLKHAPAKMSK